MNNQFKTFHDKVEQYVLIKFNNPRDIIIVLQDLKDTYAHVEMYNPIKPSKYYR